MFPVKFTRETIARAAAACKEALEHASPVTHVGYGRGKVEKVGATRRPLGPDGKVKFVRWSGGNTALVRAEPEGLFDPYVALVSFWNGDRPLAVLTYYAVHPMAFYGHGGVSADFAGVARSLREEALPGVAHIHFDGAGGDVTAGKYNGGTPADRRTLGQRLAAGMKKSVGFPAKNADHAGRRHVADDGGSFAAQSQAAIRTGPLAHDRQQENSHDVPRPRGHRSHVDPPRGGWAQIEMSCLTLGPALILHMPGELSVEYQLAAQKMRPHDFVAMAAYGDYGPGYICMAAHYSQGGYEPTASRVGPAVQGVLFAAMKELLK